MWSTPARVYNVINKILRRSKKSVPLVLLSFTTLCLGDDFPSLTIQPAPSGEQELQFQGILQSSTDLTAWTDIEPQPESPWHLSSSSISTRFFRVRAFSVEESADPSNFPLFAIENLNFQGAFRLSPDSFGESDLNYSQGPIAYNAENHSLFIVGHAHHQAIAEFAIPELVNSDRIEDLNRVDQPLQFFSTALDRTPDGNPQDINRIGGLYLYQGKLIVNAYEYYDAPGDNSHTTLLFTNAGDLANSTVSGYYSLAGRAHVSGWISGIPDAWQPLLHASHLTGFSSGIPIIGRASVGPAAFGFNPDSLQQTGDTIPTVVYQDFSLQNPLSEDLSNNSGANDLWTHLSMATYGFIVPGTRTYMTIGSSGGHFSGVGYKITQDDGNLCGGYCSYEAADNYSYYWLWDLRDWLDVLEGKMEPYELRPYDYGPFPDPLDNGRTNPVGGGAFDVDSGVLYLALQRADNQAGTYSNPPVIAVYNIGELN